MQSEGDAVSRRPAILLVILAILFAQGLQFIPGGHNDHHASHCCCACHPGHLAAVPNSSRIPVSGENSVEWHVNVQAAIATCDPALLTSSSRAPPA
jgi:hypothetical protein